MLMDFGQDIFAKIVDNLHDGLYFVDTNRVVTFWNKAAERISGFTAREVVGKSCADNVLTHIDDEGNLLCRGMCPLAATIADGKFREAEVYLHHKNGHRVPVAVRTTTLTDAEGRIIGGIELFSDISHKTDNQLRINELERLALLDHLTQLANRSYLEKELRVCFEESKRFGLSFGLLFIDIDHFKKFNDTYGHDIGDAVLKFVANTFKANTRPFDLYGRWGGEEFLGIMRHINEKDLAGTGNRMCRLIENSYIVHQNDRIGVTISIGATMAKAHDNIDQLLKRADHLLYKSKTSGRNCLSIG
jgi:diguanylate cyclase (GGDEF)-like protein/PAS domain S-box-containing protein